MKALILGIGIAIVASVLTLHFIPSVTSVEQQEVIKEVRPDWAEDEDAVQAAQDVIRRKELEAEKAQLQDEVRQREDRINQIDKELGYY